MPQDPRPNTQDFPGLPYFAFALCAAIWSSTFLAIKVGNDALPAIWACSLRLFIAAGVLLLTMALTKTPWPRGSALRAAAWYGFWEFGIGLSLLYWGEKAVASGLAAVIYATCPVASILEARALKMETMSRAKLAAAILAFAGVGLIFWREVLRGGSALGLAAIFLAACAGPFGGLMLQRGPKQSAVGTNAVAALVAAPVALLLSFLMGESHFIPTTVAGLWPVLYLAIVSSGIAFVTFAWLMNRWTVSTVAFLGVIVPVVAVILGSIVRHELFPVANLAGSVVIVVAVVIALRAEASTKLQ